MRELYQFTEKETALNYTANEIDSIKKKHIKKSGCRIYKDGFLGVAGTLGEATEDTFEAARANLERKIPYPFAPKEGIQRIRDLRVKELTEEFFLVQTKQVMKQLIAEFPDYIFSNKIKLIEREISLKNDKGLHYIDYNRFLTFEILLKHVGSLQIFDSALLYLDREFSPERFYRESKEQLLALRNKVSLPKEVFLPIIFCDNTIIRQFEESLNGEALGKGTSLLSGKMGEKIFSDSFTLNQDRSMNQINTPFFDAEGSVLPSDQVALIEKGILRHGYVDQLNAKLFTVPNTAAGEGEYDSVPKLSLPELRVVPSEKTLKELLNGELGIIAWMASGGDFTSKGDFATPIQCSFLTDGEKILGVLPEFQIKGKFLEMFGNDYIGYSRDKIWSLDHGLIIRMKVIQ